MAPLAGLSGKDVIKKFQRIGYVVTRQKGSHVRLRHPGAALHKPLTIPLQRELKKGLLKQLIQDAGLDVKTFLDL